MASNNENTRNTHTTRMEAPQVHDPCSSPNTSNGSQYVITQSTIPKENPGTTKHTLTNFELKKLLPGILSVLNEENAEYIDLQDLDLVRLAQVMNGASEVNLPTREWMLVDKSYLKKKFDATKEAEENEAKLRQALSKSEKSYDDLKFQTEKQEKDLQKELQTLKNKYENLISEEKRAKSAHASKASEKYSQRSRPKTSFERGNINHSDYVTALEIDRKAKFELERQNQDLKARVAMLTDNLSSMMNKALYRDETDFENISMKSRPMMVKEAYELFCAQQWLDAKRSIDDRLEVHEQDKLGLLNNIILDSYSLAEKMYKLQQKLFMELLKSPYKMTHELERKYEDIGEVDVESAIKNGDWTSELNIAVSKYRKLTCENADHDKMAKDCYSLPEKTYKLQQKLLMEVLKSPYKMTRELERKVDDIREVDVESAIKNGDWTSELNIAVSKYLKLNCENADHDKMAQEILFLQKKELQVSGRLQIFIKEICKISWKMVIQTPPLSFDSNDIHKPYNKDKHDLHWGSCSETTQGAKIVCYVFPAMVHGQRVLTKAKILLQ